MTRPRIVVPGATLALSRRTTRRHFLLHPDEARQMERIYWYCLGHAAQLHGVLVHAACLMSTHAHEVITDVRGEYPRFLETFHRNLALCTKALRGWPEEVFNKRSSGAHTLLTPEAMIESIAYLIANPVEALAVRYAKDWPGHIRCPPTSARGSSESSGLHTTSTPRILAGPRSSSFGWRCRWHSSSTTAQSLRGDASPSGCDSVGIRRGTRPSARAKDPKIRPTLPQTQRSSADCAVVS